MNRTERKLNQAKAVKTLNGLKLLAKRNNDQISLKDLAGFAKLYGISPIQEGQVSLLLKTSVDKMVLGNRTIIATRGQLLIHPPLPAYLTEPKLEETPCETS